MVVLRVIQEVSSVAPRYVRLGLVFLMIYLTMLIGIIMINPLKHAIKFIKKSYL